MANVNAPFGLRPVQYLNGAAWNGQARMYYIYLSDTSAYAPGDPFLKPDVQAQMARFTIQFGDKLLTGGEILDQLNYQQKYIDLLQKRLANCRE